MFFDFYPISLKISIRTVRLRHCVATNFIIVKLKTWNLHVKFHKLFKITFEKQKMEKNCVVSIKSLTIVWSLLLMILQRFVTHFQVLIFISSKHNKCPKELNLTKLKRLFGKIYFRVRSGNFYTNFWSILCYRKLQINSRNRFSCFITEYQFSTRL